MKNSIEKFKTVFPEKSLIVALHSKSVSHALEWAEIAYQNGAHGVAVVTHFIESTEWLDAIEKIKEKYPYHKAILNIIQLDPKLIFEAMTLPNTIFPDGIWTDKSDWIKPGNENWADMTLKIQEEMWREWLYFGWLDFKYQGPLAESDYPKAIAQAKKYLDVITTSGPGTGEAADVEKVKKIKNLAWDFPFALASGVDAHNIKGYIEYVDAFIVATGISKDYYNLDPEKVLELSTIIYLYNRKMARKRFEQEILKKYGVNSVTELDNYIRNNEIINIWGRPEAQEIEKKLSNLYPSPFTLDGVEYASVEAFRMYIKYPEWYANRESIRELSSLKAKMSWDDSKFIRSFKYHWEEIEMWSEKHHALLKMALRAKLQQNPDILKDLLETGDKKIIHIIFDKDRTSLSPDSKTIPWEKFAQLYTELRDEFKYRKNVNYQISFLFI